MNAPKISVLLPVYNAEKYIKESVESVLNQTYTDFEFIIVNDGSTDNSESIVLSFNDKRIKYIKNERNVGIVASLNKAIALSKGTYIARMDADDVSLKNRFEKQISFLEQNPDIGLVGSQLKVLGENNILTYPLSNPDIQFDFLMCNAIAHPVVMFRKDLLEKHQLLYEAEYFPAEDYQLWVRLSEFCEYYNFEDPLLEYRLHHSSISHSQRKQQTEKVNQIRAQYLLKSSRSWNSEDEGIISKIFSGYVITKKDELLRLNDVFSKCFESNIKFDKYKFKDYLDTSFYNACLLSQISVFMLVRSYIYSNFFGGYKRLIKLFLTRLKKGL